MDTPTEPGVVVDAATLKEILFKWSDVVIVQSNDLWTLCLPFFGVCILVIMHLHGNQSIVRPRSLMFLLYVSAASSALSLVMGYKLKGSVVTALKDTVSSKSISAIPTTASTDGLVQVTTFAIGLICFLIALGWRSEVVAKSIIDTIKGK